MLRDPAKFARFVQIVNLFLFYLYRNNFSILRHIKHYRALRFSIDFKRILAEERTRNNKLRNKNKSKPHLKVKSFLITRVKLAVALLIMLSNKLPEVLKSSSKIRLFWNNLESSSIKKQLRKCYNLMKPLSSPRLAKNLKSSQNKLFMPRVQKVEIMPLEIYQYMIVCINHQLGAIMAKKTCRWWHLINSQHRTAYSNFILTSINDHRSWREMTMLRIYCLMMHAEGRRNKSCFKNKKNMRIWQLSRNLRS